MDIESKEKFLDRAMKPKEKKWSNKVAGNVYSRERTREKELED